MITPASHTGSRDGRARFGMPRLVGIDRSQKSCKLFGRAACHSTRRPSEFAGFLGHVRPQKSCRSCRRRVLSLHASEFKLPQNPWRPARDVSRRYSRFICWIILATDGSKCNQGHRFLNQQNPRHHPPEGLELPFILGGCVKISQIDWTQASVDTR